MTTVPKEPEHLFGGKEHHLVRLGPLVWCYSPGLFWFRIFGKGLHFRDTDRHPLRFSERNGYRRLLTIRVLR